MIVAKGSHITYTINGRLTTHLIHDSPKALKEAIALQLHALDGSLFKDAKINVCPRLSNRRPRLRTAVQRQ